MGNYDLVCCSDLQEALLLLPFPSVCEILQTLPALVMRGDQTELVCKLLVFLLKIHHAPIVANNSLLSVLKQLQKSAMVKVEELRVSLSIVINYTCLFLYIQVSLKSFQVEVFFYERLKQIYKTSSSLKVSFLA